MGLTIRYMCQSLYHHYNMFMMSLNLLNALTINLAMFMSSRILLTLLGLCSIFNTSTSKAQGCSDAGFCSLDHMKPESNDSINNLRSQIKVGVFSGLGAKGTFIFGHYNEFEQRVGKRLSLNVKLTSLAQSGNGVTVAGWGDVFITSGVKLSDNWGIMGGGKIPLNDANRKENGLSLPMDYQSSFGTYDAIAGVTFRTGKWQFMTAFQQPLTQNNNQFLLEDYADDSPMRKFFSTRNFKRNADAMLRFAYSSINTSKRSTFTPGLLAVYHLQRDTYEDVNGNEVKIDGSQGLTLNTNFFWDYTISNNQSLQLNAGVPVYARPARPDGSTRNVVLNLEYRIAF